MDSILPTSFRCRKTLTMKYSSSISFIRIVWTTLAIIFCFAYPVLFQQTQQSSGRNWQHQMQKSLYATTGDQRSSKASPSSVPSDGFRTFQARVESDSAVGQPSSSKVPEEVVATTDASQTRTTLSLPKLDADSSLVYFNVSEKSKSVFEFSAAWGLYGM